MARVLLSVNTEVPSAGPAVPVLAVFDNGDWNFAFEGDTDYIAENPAYLGATPVHEIINELALLNDLEELEEPADGRIILYLQISVAIDAGDEPVVGVWEDGVTEVMNRAEANALIELGDGNGVINFIPFVDFFEELRSFVSYNAETLADDGEGYGHGDEDEEDRD